MKKILLLTAATCSLSLLIGCGPATQNIPVSTVPTGAMVYVDGKQTCVTPCNPELAKTQAHILTVKKDGYKQVDVSITQKYDTGGVVRDATQSGMRSSSWGTNTEGAIANALLSAGAAEEDGSAYVLTPSTVRIKLVKEGAAAQPATTAQNAPVEISSDQLAPEDQKAIVQTTEPTTVGDAAAEDPLKTAEQILEGAAVAAPTIGTKSTSSHSHSSESYSDDGSSYSKSTTKTSTSVGVSVNPVEAGLGVLHLLEGAEKKKDSEEGQPTEK